MMARFYVVVALVCLAGAVAADDRVEHRTDLKALQDQAALQGYDLQIVPKDSNVAVVESDVVEYDSDPVSILSLLSDLVPSPIVGIKTIVVTIVSKILKLAKLLMPVNLVLLGMGLVIGFCAFTPYCTMIIEEPVASKIRVFKSHIPYIDEIQHYVYDGIEKIHALQG